MRCCKLSKSQAAGPVNTKIYALTNVNHFDIVAETFPVRLYATPLIEVSSKCLFTNTTPVGAYRGAGRPEGNYYMERLVETAAREMGIDRVALRSPQSYPAGADAVSCPIRNGI